MDESKIKPGAESRLGRWAPIFSLLPDVRDEKKEHNLIFFLVTGGVDEYSRLIDQGPGENFQKDILNNGKWPQAVCCLVSGPEGEYRLSRC